MPRIEVIELNFTAAAVDTLWRRGVTPKQEGSVLGRRWVTTRNRANRAASYLLIGRDDQGRCLTMPVVPMDHPLVWRVITGWQCKPSEAAKLR